MVGKNTTLRIDEELRAASRKVLQIYGLSLNSTMILFLRQCVIEGRIPFEVDVDPTALEKALDQLHQQ